jgi:hypothetical protein
MLRVFTVSKLLDSNRHAEQVTLRERVHEIAI